MNSIVKKSPALFRSDLWGVPPPAGGGVVSACGRRGDGRHHFFSFPSKEKKRFRASKEEKGAWPTLRQINPEFALPLQCAGSAGATFLHVEMPATRLGIKKVRKNQFPKTPPKKGFQNRRFWRLFGDFSGGEKVTRAGARNAPCPPRRGRAPAGGAITPLPLP